MIKLEFLSQKHHDEYVEEQHRRISALKHMPTQIELPIPKYLASTKYGEVKYGEVSVSMSNYVGENVIALYDTSFEDDKEVCGILEEYNGKFTVDGFSVHTVITYE